MKRILALLCLCLTAVLLFCSCGGAALFDKEEIENNDTHNTYGVTEVEAIAGYSMVTSSYTAGYGVFSKTDATNITYKVFSFVTGSVVCEITQKTSDLEPEFGFGGETGLFYIANKNTDGVVEGYTIYGKDGTVIATGNSDIAPSFAGDRVLYDNKIYQAKDGALVEKAKVVDWNTALKGPLPAITDYADGVYAKIDKTDTMGIMFYDEKFDLTGLYYIPENANDPMIEMLANGNVFVQYMVMLPFDANSYDVTNNMVKYDIIQLLVKPNGSVSKVDLGAYVDELVRYDEDETLMKADNFVLLIPIVDKQIQSEYTTEVYELKNNGRLGTEFPKFDGDYAIDFTALGNGYLLAETIITDRTLLLDKNLKVVGDVSGCRDYTDRYIVGTDGIYDYELNRLLAFKKNDGEYSYVTTCGSNIILKFTDKETGDNSAYIFDGKETKITSDYTRYQSLSDKLYTVRPIDNTIDNTATVYAPDGTVLVSEISIPRTMTNRQNDNLLLYGSNASGETVYYYLTAR